MTQRAIGYGRVSYDDTDTDGSNLKGQLQMCAEHIHKRGYQLVDLLGEDASGASGVVIDLPVLNDLRARAEAGSFDVLVVRELDRLSRDLSKQLFVEAELKRCGVEIEYVLFDYPDTPEGRFMKHVRACVAELEREKIIERTSRARTNKAKRGQWVGTGFAPYGYRKRGELKTAELVIEPGEAALVRRIFSLYLGLDGEMPLPLRAIARRLNDEGLPPPGTTKPGARRYTPAWHVATLQGMIARRTYLGEFAYGEVVVHLPHLAIVDEETWAAAQDRRRHNQQMARRNTKHEFLLGSRLRCTCQVLMRGKSHHYERRRAGHEGTSVYRYYQCLARSCYSYVSQCQEPHVSTPKADALVWDWVWGVLRDPERIQRGLAELKDQQRKALTPKRARLAELVKLIGKEDSRLERLAADLAELEAPRARAAVVKQLTQASTRRDTLTAEQASLQRELEQGEIPEEQQRAILTAARKFIFRLDNANYEQKRETLELLNLQTQLARDEAGRWLEAEISLPLPPVALVFEGSHRTGHKGQKELVVFRARLPLEGQESDGALAIALFSKSSMSVAP